MLVGVVQDDCEEKRHEEVDHEEEELKLHDVLHELGDQNMETEHLDYEDAVQEQKHYEVNVLELEQEQLDHARTTNTAPIDACRLLHLTHGLQYVWICCPRQRKDR